LLSLPKLTGTTASPAVSSWSALVPAVSLEMPSALRFCPTDTEAAAALLSTAAGSTTEAVEVVQVVSGMASYEKPSRQTS
jgi:hypothetical protein